MREEILSLFSKNSQALIAYHPTISSQEEIRLDANECGIKPSQEENEAVFNSWKSLCFERYPDPRASSLRLRLHSLLDVAPEGFLFANGLDEIIHIIVHALRRPRTGKEHAYLLHAEPGFVMYRQNAIAAGVEPIGIFSDTNGEFSKDAIESLIETYQPNLVFLTSPNNPTGTCIPQKTMEDLIKKFSHTIFVIDEAYIDYQVQSGWPTKGMGISLALRYDNVLALRSYSKVGFAALRFGFAFGNPSLIRWLDKFRLPFALSSTTLLAAEALLADRVREKVFYRIRQVCQERLRIFDALVARNIPVLPSFANFFYLPKSLGMSLLEKGIRVRAISTSAPLSDGVRVTIGSQEQNDRFILALDKILAH